MNTNYQSWLVNNKDYADNHIFATEGPDCKWGRLKTEWTEIVFPSEEVRKEVIERGSIGNAEVTYRTHTLALCINRETGDFYEDTTKKKIYVKMLAHTLRRPLFVLDTLYYVCFPVAMTIAYRKARKEMEESVKLFSESEIKARCRQAAFNALADIVRTPVYGIAMIVVSATALIVGPLAPKKLYDFREMENQLMRKYYRIPNGHFTTPFECFLSINNIQRQEKYSRRYLDTVYSNPNSKIENAMNNYTKAFINHHREHASPCFKNGRKLEKDEIYTSPTMADIEKLQSTTV